MCSGGRGCWNSWLERRLVGVVGAGGGNKGNLARWECKGLGKRGVCRNKARESE